MASEILQSLEDDIKESIYDRRRSGVWEQSAEGAGVKLLESTSVHDAIGRASQTVIFAMRWKHQAHIRAHNSQKFKTVTDVFPEGANKDGNPGGSFRLAEGAEVEGAFGAVSAVAASSVDDGGRSRMESIPEDEKDDMLWARELGILPLSSPAKQQTNTSTGAAASKPFASSGAGEASGMRATFAAMGGNGSGQAAVTDVFPEGANKDGNPGGSFRLAEGAGVERAFGAVSAVAASSVDDGGSSRMESRPKSSGEASGVRATFAPMTGDGSEQATVAKVPQDHRNEIKSLHDHSVSQRWSNSLSVPGMVVTPSPHSAPPQRQSSLSYVSMIYPGRPLDSPKDASSFSRMSGNMPRVDYDLVVPKPKYSLSHAMNFQGNRAKRGLTRQFNRAMTVGTVNGDYDKDEVIELTCLPEKEKARGTWSVCVRCIRCRRAEVQEGSGNEREIQRSKLRRMSTTQKEVLLTKMRRSSQTLHEPEGIKPQFASKLEGTGGGKQNKKGKGNKRSRKSLKQAKKISNELKGVCFLHAINFKVRSLNEQLTEFEQQIGGANNSDKNTFDINTNQVDLQRRSIELTPEKMMMEKQNADDKKLIKENSQLKKEKRNSLKAAYGTVATTLKYESIDLSSLSEAQLKKRVLDSVNCNFRLQQSELQEQKQQKLKQEQEASQAALLSDQDRHRLQLEGTGGVVHKRRKPITCEMISFSETKLTKMAWQGADGACSMFVELFQKNISRSYPAGYRIDSSNYNPTMAWTLGIQMVSLNTQTHDLGWEVNFGMFRRNSGCGFVLKPDCLLEKQAGEQPWSPVDGPFDAPPGFALSVTIISAQYIPRNDKDKGKDKRKKSVDKSKKEKGGVPSVRLELRGIPADCGSFITNNVRKGDAFYNDGSDNTASSKQPDYWDERASFSLMAPELAFLNMQIIDGNGQLIGFNTLPVTGLREGYRRVAVYSRDGRSVHDHEFCSVFVHFAFSHEVKRTHGGMVVTPSSTPRKNRLVLPHQPTYSSRSRSSPDASHQRWLV
jgi:hypothetical protein